MKLKRTSKALAWLAAVMVVGLLPAAAPTDGG